MKSSLEALKSLAELALSVPGVEPLIIYDAVALVAGNAALHKSEPARRELRKLSATASATARWIRLADEKQLEFREFISGEKS